jgi:hypothetical protein
MAKNRQRDALAWGIVLILIGLVIFLHNLKISVWDSVARLWPLVLIVWGAWKLYFGITEHKEESESMKGKNES